MPRLFENLRKTEPAPVVSKESYTSPEVEIPHKQKVLFWAKKHWRTLLLLSTLSGAGAGAYKVHQMLNHPVERGRVTAAVDAVLQQTLGPQRASLAHEYLDDLEEYLRKEGYAPGDIRYLFTGDAVGYRQEKVNRARLQFARDVISQEQKSFSFFFVEIDPQEEEQYSKEIEAEKAADLAEFYQRLPARGEALEQYLANHPDLRDPVTEIVAALYLYPGLEDPSATLSAIEFAPLQRTVEEVVLEILSTLDRQANESTSPSSESTQHYDSLAQYHTASGRSIELFVGALVLTEEQPTLTRIQVLAETARTYIQDTNNYRANTAPTQERFISYLDEPAQRWLQTARSQLSQTPLTASDLGVLMNRKVVTAPDIADLAEFREAFPDAPIALYLELSNITLWDNTHSRPVSATEHFAAITQLQEVFAESNAAVTLSFAEALDMYDMLSRFPGGYTEELLAFLAEENFDLTESALFLAYHHNLTALQGESFSWSDAMVSLEELLKTLGLSASDTTFALQLANRFPPGERGTTKLVADSIPVDEYFTFVNAQETANQITLAEFTTNFAEFYAQYGKNFASRQLALSFFAATFPTDTRGRVTDIAVLKTARELALRLYGEALYELAPDRIPPSQVISLFENILSKLMSEGTQVNTLQELDMFLGDVVGSSIELPNLHGRILQLPVTQVTFDPHSTDIPDAEVAGFGSPDNPTAGDTRLPLVFFEMGGAHSLNAIFYKEADSVTLLNPGIEPADYDRNIWIFTDGKLEIKRLKELGSTPEEICSALNTPGFTTAFIPSNLLWDEYDSNPEERHLRKLDVVWSWMHSQVVHYMKDGTHQLAILHLEGTGLEYASSEDEQVAYFDAFLAAVEQSLGGTLLEIVPFDPAISSQITVTSEDTTHTYSFMTPVASPFGGGNTRKFSFPAIQAQ